MVTNQPKIEPTFRKFAEQNRPNKERNIKPINYLENSDLKYEDYIRLAYSTVKEKVANEKPISQMESENDPRKEIVMDVLDAIKFLEEIIEF